MYYSYPLVVAIPGEIHVIHSSPWAGHGGARQSFAEARGLHVDGSGTSGHLSFQRPVATQGEGAKCLWIQRIVLDYFNHVAIL